MSDTTLKKIIAKQQTLIDELRTELDSLQIDVTSWQERTESIEAELMRLKMGVE